MECLETANMSLNYDKSTFFQPTINVCSYKVSSEGIFPLEDHMQAIKFAPAPSDTKELHSFLGICGWFSQFIPDYASLTEPLFTLLKKGSFFKWTTHHDAAFCTLKEKIASTHPLQWFIPGGTTYVTTDASVKGAGVVLSQVDASGKECVAFWSRRFSPCEQKYSVTEHEASAAVSAVEK